MHRLLFEKTGNAIWISHLDLMRLFQRAFKRAGLSLTHTQGYSPKPSVSIAMPLSVGVESVCELLDFDLEGDAVSDDEIVARLNQTLVDGVRVLQAYDNGKKIKEGFLLSAKDFNMLNKLKELQNAQLYYNLGNYMGNNYESAVIVAKNAIKDYPYSKYTQALELLILKARYQEASQSVDEKKADRFRVVLDEYYSFINNYPDSHNRKEADNIYHIATKYIND